MHPGGMIAKSCIENGNKQILRITGVDRNGININITDENIMQDGFSIDRFSSNSDKLEIGTAIAAEMTLKLDNRQGQFNSVRFEGTELFVEIGYSGNWDVETPLIFWLSCGYFTCYEQPRSLDIITIHALDRMMRFDRYVPAQAEVDWTDQSTNEITDENGEVICFRFDLKFPTTVAGLVNQICNVCSITLKTSLNQLPNYGEGIDALPQTDEVITSRKLIQWCAGMMGTNAWIDWDGKLNFSWSNNANSYVTTLENRFSSDLYENDLRITGVRFQDTDENSTIYLAGADDYTVDLTGNLLISDKSATRKGTILGRVYTAVHDYTYRPFTASVISTPYLYPMDRIIFRDKDGVNHQCLLTNVNFGINCASKLASRGVTQLTGSISSPSAFTLQQSQQLQHIQRVTSTALSQAVDHATQMITGGLGGYVILNVNETTGQTEEILIMDNPDKTLAVNVWRFNQGGLGHSSNGYNGPFNDVALTADGQINANMITVGEMVADRIKGGTLTLGGQDNVNGHLELKNSQNNVVGIWNKDGLNVGNGNFTVDMSGELTAQGATIEDGAIKGGTIQIGKYYDQSQNELYVFSVTQYGALKVTSSLNGDWIMIDQGRIIGGIAGQDESTASAFMNFKGAFDDGDGIYIEGDNITLFTDALYTKDGYNLRQGYTGLVPIGNIRLQFYNGLFYGTV